MIALMKNLKRKKLYDSEILHYLEQNRMPEDNRATIGRALRSPPSWVKALREVTVNDGQWEVVGPGKGKRTSGEEGMWTFWRRGGDLDHLEGLQ